MLIDAGHCTVDLIEADDMVVLAQRRDGEFEPVALQEWSRLCVVGGVAVDIGAYSGVYAIAAAKAGCHVLAFEPLPTAYARLQENAVRNGVSFSAHQIACADVPGTLPFWFNGHMQMTSAGSLNFRRNASIKVEARTLDSFNLMGVTAIKIDAEGAELRVLQGARETLERCRPALIIEVLEGGARASAILFAVELGYKCRALDDRNWLLEPDRDEHMGEN